LTGVTARAYIRATAARVARTGRWRSKERDERMPARERILAVLDEIRPALRSDGGDVELVAYDEADGVVQLRLMGACHTCPISTMTLKQGIERRILVAVPEVREVHAN